MSKQPQLGSELSSSQASPRLPQSQNLNPWPTLNPSPILSMAVLHVASIVSLPEFSTINVIDDPTKWRLTASVSVLKRKKPRQLLFGGIT